jgi:hypothetical protein
MDCAQGGLPNRSPKRLKGDITYHQRHKIGFAPQDSGVQRKHHLHFAVPHGTGLSTPLSQTHYPAQNMNSDYSLWYCNLPNQVEMLLWQFE